MLRWLAGRMARACRRSRTCWSDGKRELVEGVPEPVAAGDIDGEFIVTTADVLHERVPGGDDPRGPVAF